MMQRSGYSTSTHSKSGTDRNRIATTSSGITLDNIYQSVTDNEQKINVLDAQSSANTNEITVLQNRIKMLEEIIKNLVNIDASGDSTDLATSAATTPSKNTRRFSRLPPFTR